jgi:bifunctional UDP-N-acetylglucosamine pyrophosphorylase/glucosamine-1-phosphate N-acetyltransferase
VSLKGETKIGSGVVVDRNSVVINCEIAAETVILPFSYLEDSKIGEKCSVGPFARIRPGTQLEKSVKIGNFVEIKKSRLKEKSKVSHLSYVGDAEIGKNSNIGCGFITCNYDGVKKHQTVIGDNTFIGSDCQVIAPIKIGSHCYVAAGSTINEDMPDECFAIARSRQANKPGLAKRFLPS